MRGEWAVIKQLPPAGKSCPIEGYSFNRGLRGGFRFSMCPAAFLAGHFKIPHGAKFIMASRKAIIQYLTREEEILRRQDKSLQLRDKCCRLPSVRA